MLFREFFRSDSAEVKAQAGTGLGLTIVDRIVARHAGRIEVDSGARPRHHVPDLPAGAR